MEPPLLTQQLPGGPATTVTFFDALLFRLPAAIPDGMLFAARWWLSPLLLLIFAPLWFREVTGRARFGALCALLVFFAPSNQWWSYRPAIILGFLFAACYLAFPAYRAFAARRWLAGTALAALCAILLARYPTNYQPFAIVLGLPVLTVTAVRLLRVRPMARVPLALTFGVIGLVWGVVFAGLLHENWSSIQAVANTVYPGSRRSSGTPQAAWSFFSGPVLGPLTTSDPVVGSNASEISTGFTFAAVWAAILLVFSRSLRERADRWVIGTAMGFTLLWLSWMTFDWGDMGLRVPIMNLVQPGRAGMATVGILASITLCLVLSYWRPTGSARMIAAGSALACGALTLWGGRSLQAIHYPSLATHWIVVSAIAVAVTVAAITLAPNRLWPFALTAVFLVLVTGRVNPVILGLGDLRDSDTAKSMLAYGQEARATGAVWASDSVFIDALFMATAVPSISARQQTGPIDAAWERLDPGATDEDVWNRAGAFVNFQWGDDGTPLALSNQSPDFIAVRISPCELRRRFPEVRNLVASRPLRSTCLTPIRRAQWVGAPMWIYGVTPG